MDEQWFQWAVGILIPLLVAAFSMVIAQIRALRGTVDENDKDTDTMFEGVHRRINEVRNDYVRRDDFSASNARLEDALKQLRDENRANHGEMMRLLTSTITKKGY